MQNQFIGIVHRFDGAQFFLRKGGMIVNIYIHSTEMRMIRSIFTSHVRLFNRHDALFLH